MSTMSELKKLSAALNEASNELGSIIKDTEINLRMLNLGVEAWVSTPLNTTTSQRLGAETCYEAEYLGWSKIDSEWCLTIKTVMHRNGFFEGDTSAFYTDTDLLHVKALRGARRDIRAQAVTQFDDLMCALRDEAKHVLAAVDKGKKFLAGSGE